MSRKRGERKGHYSNWGNSSWGDSTYRSGHKSYDDDHGYGSYGTSFDGLVWQKAGEMSPGTYDNDTIYNPIQLTEYLVPPFTYPDFLPIIGGTDFPGIQNPASVLNDTAVQFNVSQKAFEVALAYSLADDDDDFLSEAIGDLLDLSDGVVDAFNDAKDDYDFAASARFEGWAKADPNETSGVYAKNFFVGDELEFYGGFFHSDGDEVFTVGIEVELTKKGKKHYQYVSDQFDLLFDGGTMFDPSQSVGEIDFAQLAKLIDEVEIEFFVDDSTEHAAFVSAVGGALEELATDFGDSFSTFGIDVEIEDGRPRASKWGRQAISELLADVNATPD